MTIGQNSWSLGFITAGTNVSRNWNIRATQIPCDSRLTAQDQCLQYYTDAVGTISSFNYAPTTLATAFPSTIGRQLSNQDYIICIRKNQARSVWNRKPRHLGTAKSKLFRIPQKPRYPEDEVQEMRRLRNIYNTGMKSVKQYFFQEYLKLADTGAVALHAAKSEEEEHVRLMEVNRLENEKTAALREERLARQRASEKERIAQALLNTEQVDQVELDQIESLVMKEISLVDKIITRDNLERAIEEALANPVDYNFALDREGFVYRGSEKMEQLATS
nr:EOG090X0FQ9 [Triops cancriformis]